MNASQMTLDQLPLQKKARIVSIHGVDKERLHLLEMGLIKNSPIECVHKTLFGGPRIYQIRGTKVALRQSDAYKIQVSLSEDGFSFA